MTVRIKYCGFTAVEDVRTAIDVGVDAIGINLAAGPRKVDNARARHLAEVCPPFVVSVALFKNADEATILKAMNEGRCQAIQLHGDETPELAASLRRRFPVIKAFAVASKKDLERIAGFPADAYLLDARSELGGGSGTSWDHGLLDGITFDRPLILAGGLTANTVAAAVKQVKPWAVDVSSGIESAPGRKSPEKMRDFAAACRHA